MDLYAGSTPYQSGFPPIWMQFNQQHTKHVNLDSFKGTMCRDVHKYLEPKIEYILGLTN